jgi:hypothetical protein
MADGRDDKGRFLKGNAGGPGRPQRETERAYLTALVGVVSLRAWRAICKQAVADARAGDRHAREWLGRYLIGNVEAELLAERIKELERMLPRGGVR